jgi:hypothetical protein
MTEVIEAWRKKFPADKKLIRPNEKLRFKYQKENYGGQSSKVQIKNSLKEHKVNTSDEDSKCLIM